MKFSVADQAKGNFIHSYTEHSVVINGTTFSSSLVVMEDTLIPDWRPDSFPALTEQDFSAFIDLKPDMLILGTGLTQRFPKPALYSALINSGIGVEIMTTPAACRTYNILTAEGRRVVAALLFD